MVLRRLRLEDQPDRVQGQPRQYKDSLLQNRKEKVCSLPLREPIEEMVERV